MENTRPDPKWEFIKIGFDSDDVALLKDLVAAEKLSRADVVRRAIREYAKQVLKSDATKVA